MASDTVTIEDLARKLQALAEKLGEIAPGRGRQLVEVIVPRTPDTAFAGSLSRKYGLGSLPLHTDTAHWPLPCRYLLIACASPGPIPTPTLLLDARRVQLSVAEEVACASKLTKSSQKVVTWDFSQLYER
jgi:hypothetical protein